MNSSYIYLASALAVMCVSCGIETADETPPAGPDGSWWTGGADGGVFVDVREDENPNDNIYYGTIYYEHDNSIWYQGQLQLEGAVESFNPRDKSAYEGWDGNTLYLVNGQHLEAIEPIPTME